MKGQSISINTLAKIVLLMMVLLVVVVIAQNQIEPLVEDSISSIMAHRP